MFSHNVSRPDHGTANGASQPEYSRRNTLVALSQALGRTASRPGSQRAETPKDVRAPTISGSSSGRCEPERLADWQAWSSPGSLPAWWPVKDAASNRLKRASAKSGGRPGAPDRSGETPRRRGSHGPARGKRRQKSVQLAAKPEDERPFGHSVPPMPIGSLAHYPSFCILHSSFFIPFGVACGKSERRRCRRYELFHHRRSRQAARPTGRPQPARFPMPTP